MMCPMKIIIDMSIIVDYNLSIGAPLVCHDMSGICSIMVFFLPYKLISNYN